MPFAELYEPPANVVIEVASLLRGERASHSSPEGMDIELVDDVLSSVAAAEIMPRFGQLSTTDVVTKTSAFDIVSTADWAAEKAITEAIRQEYPRATVIREEAAAEDPGIVGGLGEADIAFVLDPLDGTKNFVAGLPLFAVMAAVVERGRIAAGVIHDPIPRTSVIATEGGGAWICRGGQDILMCCESNLEPRCRACPRKATPPRCS